MKSKSPYSTSFLLLFLVLSATGGLAKPAGMQVNYYDFINPGKWYFIPGGLTPPWELRIWNQMIYNESSPFPAKIVMGQNSSSGPNLRLDLGFFNEFILQVRLDPGSAASQVTEIPWSATNTTIVTLENSFLSISNETLKLLKRPIADFRLDFFVFWAKNQVLIGGELYIRSGRPAVPSNPILALMYNISRGIGSIRAVDLAFFVIVVLITYKGWAILLERLGGKHL